MQVWEKIKPHFTEIGKNIEEHREGGGRCPGRIQILDVLKHQKPK